MIDKRNHKRFTLNVSEINGTVMFGNKVKVIDISINGVSLESTKRLNLGNSYAFHLTDKRKTIALRGNVVWSSLVESKKGPSGNVIPVYKVGMNFIDMSHEKGIELLNFILENQVSRMYKGTAAISESGSESPIAFIEKTEHSKKFRGSMGYHKAPGFAEHPNDQQIKKNYQAAATGEVSLKSLIVPRKVLATTGKAVTLKAHAVAASKDEDVPVTVTLKAVPAAGVKVEIHPANITKEVNRHTDFCFSSRIVCASSGTWQIKWSAKLSLSKWSYTASEVLTGTTYLVCRDV